MSESSESTSSYVTPDPEPVPQALPSTFIDRDRTVGTAPYAAVAPRRKWIKSGFVVGWGIAILIGVGVRSCLYNPDNSGPPTDPEGVTRDTENGCVTNGRIAEPGTFGCQVREDIQGMGSEVPPRTYVKPLPEGESGRVGYNRVDVQAATTVDLSPGLVLTL